MDKSSYDGHVDWVAARARGIEWATIRASYGLNADPLHIEEAKAAAAAGVHVAPYHYYIPGQNPIKQAEKFLSSTEGGDLPPVIDLEDYSTTKAYGGIWKAEIRPWLEYVEAAIGIQPAIYSGPGYIRDYLQNDTEASEYKWLIAHYEAAAPLISKPLTPLSAFAWQFGDGRDAHFYGFNDAWGCALYVGEIDDLVKPWKSGTVPPPAPAPVGFSTGIARYNVTIRSGPGKTYAAIFPFLLLVGRSVVVLDVLQSGEDIWIEIAEGQWCAARYQGTTLIELK